MVGYTSKMTVSLFLLLENTKQWGVILKMTKPLFLTKKRREEWIQSNITRYNGLNVPINSNDIISCKYDKYSLCFKKKKSKRKWIKLISEPTYYRIIQSIKEDNTLIKDATLRRAKTKLTLKQKANLLWGKKTASHIMKQTIIPSTIAALETFDITRFFNRIKRQMKTKHNCKFEYIWVFEVYKNETWVIAPHYHIVLWYNQNQEKYLREIWINTLKELKQDFAEDVNFCDIDSPNKTIDYFCKRLYLKLPVSILGIDHCDYIEINQNTLNNGNRRFNKCFGYSKFEQIKK